MISLHLDQQDSKSRELALEHYKSFIVQAPAGSGKTELITQRVLNLLAYVNKPEEIVALTFTRKAASEMKSRIIDSLQSAMLSEPKEAHKLLTYKLAKTALVRDSKLKWGLLHNPARLNITTIDSLCAKIVKQTPVLSKLGSDMVIIDEPSPYYEQAVNAVFSLINTNDYDSECIWTNNLKILIQHFASDYNKLKKFLLAMLYKRDQWLPYVVNTSEEHMHQLMQYCWHELANDVISEIKKILPLNIQSELSELLYYAANNLQNLEDYNESQLQILEYDANDLNYWQAVSNLLFSASNGSKLNFRQRLDKRMGFPSKSDFKIKAEQERANIHKQKLLSLINLLDNNSSHQIFDLFALIRKLPSFDYSDDNWNVLATLSRILKLLEAELRLIFKSNKLIDFSGVAQSALYSLGGDDNPSDLGLYFDYSIKHILVDEFQDTSYTQFKLLQKLTANWDGISDGKTLFVVGDPQQSIYRFRQAEVGLFLQAKQSGIGKIHLEFLALSKNFRSQQQIVDWVNSKFVNIFPKSSNILFGAVSYDNSVATKSINPELTPNLRFFVKSNSSYLQDEYLLNSIKKIIDIAFADKEIEKKPVSIAILVRNRNKVLDLISLLKNNHIKINAVDIELLSEKMAIKDLLSLTKAVLDLSDRAAWLSILRAPWCGLTLTELYMLTFGNDDKSVWQSVCQFLESKQNTDSENILAEKIKNLVLVLTNIFEKLYQLEFYKIIEQAWYALGGYVIYSSIQEKYDAKQFFELLFRLEQSNFILNIDDLIRNVDKLYASNNVFLPEIIESQEDKNSEFYTLDVMTIHKSKGLQFDHVFLPYLDSVSKVNEHQMLAWQAYHNENVNGILLAPYYIKDNKQIKFYEALRFIEQQKENYELSRLFYVAVTRSIKSCILTASISEDSIELLKEQLSKQEPLAKMDLKISQKSILGQFFNHLNHNEIIIDDSCNTISKLNSEINQDNKSLQLRCLDFNQYNLQNILDNPSNSHCEYFVNKTRELFAAPVITDNPASYVIEDESFRIIGVFVHKIFYNIVTGVINKSNILNDNSINTHLADNWKNLLLTRGICLDKINTALSIVTKSIKNTLMDKVGCWILADYEISFAEKEIYYKSKNKLNKSVIDRIFIDNNTIWVIDYKITEDKHGSLEQYKQQLQHYGYLVQHLFKDKIIQNNHNIKLGLYYPIDRDFICWDYV